MVVVTFAMTLTMLIGDKAEEPSTKIAKGAAEVVRTGFQFLEGPAADKQGRLYFTDIPAHRIYLLDLKTNDLTIFNPQSNHANGLFIWKDWLLACEMDGRIVRYRAGEVDSREVLAESFHEKRFNAPNDLVVDRAGGVYFTDPEYRAPMPWPQEVRSVYYLSADRKISRVVENLPNPNGIILSPDEKTLYVAPSSQAEIWSFAVRSPGMLEEGRVFAKLQQREGSKDSGGDGVTIDSTGSLYVTSSLGIQVFDSKGGLTEIIAVPEVPANCTFGPDGTTLYITARTTLYRVPTHRKAHVFGTAMRTNSPPGGHVSTRPTY